jgi:predicted HTH domain antitoxin
MSLLVCPWGGSLSSHSRPDVALAQASRLAEMDQLAFQAVLADREIPVHCGVDEFREDLRTLGTLDRG